MDSMTNLTILTGPACAGKSTVLNILRQRGYVTIDEVASQVIIEGEYSPTGDMYQFQAEIARRITAAEEQYSDLNPNVPVIMDRGLLDAAAFFKVAGLELPAYLDEAIFRNFVYPRYTKVFLFKPLDTWEDNGVRYGDLETGRKVYQILKKIHPNCIIVPVAPPETRADFVEANLC